MPTKKRSATRHMARVYDDTWDLMMREMKRDERARMGSYRGISATMDELIREALEARYRKRERSGKNVA